MRYVLSIMAFTLLSLGVMARDYGVVSKKSELNFSIEKFSAGITVEGKFKTFSGEASIKDQLLKKLTGKVVVASIDTGDGKRDDHLRASDFFAVKSYPLIKVKIKKSFPFKLGVSGNHKLELEMKGHKKMIDAKLTVKQNSKKQYIITGESIINRYDFGVTWNRRQDKKEESILESLKNFAKGLGDQYVIDKDVKIKFKMLLLPKA